MCVLATACNIKIDNIQFNRDAFDAINDLFKFANMGVKPLKASVG